VKIGAIIQARVSSERLPGKVLLKLPGNSGTTALEQVVNRVRRSTLLDNVIIATSTDSSDQPIVNLAESKNYAVHKGSLNNVLERFHSAAEAYSLDTVVRITGDCPCIDPAIIDLVIKNHIKENADFTSCSFKRTFPVGIDVSVIKVEALQQAYEKATTDYDQEHVTSYFYLTKPDDFKIKLVKAPPEYRNPDIRLTLDTFEDYIFLCVLYDQLFPQNEFFNLDEIFSLYSSKPWIFEINKQVVQKGSYPDVLSELSAVLGFCKKQGLNRIQSYLEDHINEIQKRFS